MDQVPDTVVATVPKVIPPTETEPLLFKTTGSDKPLDVLVPRTRLVLRFDELPLAVAPAVATVMLQGLMINVLPKPNGELAGNEDVVMVRIHEP